MAIQKYVYVIIYGNMKLIVIIIKKLYVYQMMNVHQML